MGEEDIDNQLSRLADSFGPFAPRPGTDLTLLALNMLFEIDVVEKLLQGKASSLNEYRLAIAIRNYCSWYVRGAERTQYLARALSHFHKAIDIDGYTDAKVELARILIDEKSVRDLTSALKLTNDLKDAGLLPDWMQSLVEKAKRWSGKVEIPSGNDFSDLTAAPAVIREERTKLRMLITEAFKVKDTSRATVLALRLYNLGLLAAYLYGAWDASSGVTGAIFDTANEKFQKVKAKFNFNYLGRIIDAEFLSAKDYKRLEQLLGTKPSTISVDEIKSLF